MLACQFARLPVCGLASLRARRQLACRGQQVCGKSATSQRFWESFPWAECRCYVLLWRLFAAGMRAKCLSLRALDTHTHEHSTLVLNGHTLERGHTQNKGPKRNRLRPKRAQFAPFFLSTATGPPEPCIRALIRRQKPMSNSSPSSRAAPTRRGLCLGALSTLAIQFPFQRAHFQAR